MEKTKKIVMTGATGHVGYALLLELIKNGARPTILIRKDSKIFDGLDCEKVFGDVTDPESLEKAFKGADVVYHSAGVIELKKGNEQMVYNVNVNGTKNVVAACKKCGVKKLVYMSSVDAYHPLPDGQMMHEVSHYDPEILEGTYAKTKAIATQFVIDSNGTDGLETIIIQPSACIGPYDFKVSSIGEMVRMFLKGSFPVTLSFGMYNFVDVRDVAAASVAAEEKGRPGECYIICGGTITVDEFIRLTAKAFGKKAPTFKLRKWMTDLAVPIMEVYYKATNSTPLFTRYSIRKLISNCNFSNEKARKELDYNPMSVEKSIQDMVDWVKANAENKK